MRLVYYSLANSPGSHCEWQWIQSVRSLRRYNASIRVCLVLYNGAQQSLLDEAARLHVAVEYAGTYADALCQLHPHGAVLALYPTLHKFLAAPRAAGEGVSQVLYLDCDTFFFGDVERLFDRYPHAAWNSREEPMTRQSHYGYDPSHVDEDALAATATRGGFSLLTPFNAGVCLFNGGIWQEFPAIAQRFLETVWRLLVGREMASDDCAEGDAEMRAAVLQCATAQDRARALPYPSGNGWILDQVALWLTLAELPGFSLELLRREDVWQGGEFSEGEEGRPVLVHYFSTLQEEFFATFGSLDV